MRLNRFRLQYSLRGLLLFVLLVSVFMSWFGARYRAACQQRDAAAAIAALGGAVVYDYEGWARYPRSADDRPPGPAWARRLLGVDFFANVVAVAVSSRFGDLNPGRPGGNPIDDAWLEQIGRLIALEGLDLEHSKVTDAGVARLGALTRLRELDLFATRITDGAMESLDGLVALQNLNLDLTHTTDVVLCTWVGFPAWRSYR